MKTYNAAIIGLGNIGFLLSLDPKRKGTWSHSYAYLNCERTTLVGAVEPDAEKRRLFIERFPDVQVHETIDNLFANHDIDVVSICTPTATHYEVFRELSGRPVKAIFCEKPFTLNLHESRKCIEMAERSEIIVAVNHTRRWNANYRRGAVLTGLGEIGTVTTVNAFYPGQIYNIGTHLFDTIRILLNRDPIMVSGVFTSSAEKKDPSVSGVIMFKGDIFCTFAATGKREDMIFEVDVIGSEGRVQVLKNGMEVNVYRFMESKNYSGYRELGESGKFAGDAGDPLLEAVNEIVEVLDGEKSRVSCDALDGYWSLAIVEAALQSAREGSGFVSVQSF